MAKTQNFTSRFADCTKAVLQTPDDFHTKSESLALLKQMKTLAAGGERIAQYQLAQAYAKNSPQYLKWMEAAAEQGLANAMFALVHVYAENGKVPAIQNAASYVIKILYSNDSFIKDEAKALMKRHHLLEAEVSRQMSSVSKSGIGFFAFEAKNTDFDEVDLPNQVQP